jgi:hypothetical protein
MPEARSLLHQSERDRLVRRLERLAKDWPEGYTIASMGGTLCLFASDDQMTEDGRGMDAEKALWKTTKIPNTGGDW